MGGTASIRTLVVGIDAACFSVLKPLFEAGATPTLQRLVTDGAAAPLASQHPPWTPSAWPSLYTGVNPGKHGVFGFLTFDGYDWDVVNRTHVRAPALWEQIDHHGGSSVVVNVPVTHPPGTFDGALIPGYTAPENPTCHPDGILADVRDAIGDYTIYARTTAGRDKAVREYCRLVQNRGQAFRYLADRFDPNFGFLQFQQSDTVFHERPGDADAVQAVYEAIDTEIEATLDAVNPQTVVVVSDHGIGEYNGHELRVNTLLRDNGYVEPTRDGGGMPSWSSLAQQHLQENTENALHRLVEHAIEITAKGGLTSQRIAAALTRVGLADIVARHAPTGAIRAGTERVDFAHSTAYMRSRIECGIRINLAGREPAGVVAPDEYDAVRADLMTLLRDVTTPDGEPVFDKVVRREAVYDGPYVEEAPDILVVPADYDQYLSASLRSNRFGPPSEPYNHKRHGIVMAAGTSINTTATIDEAHLFDVAPTILASLDIPANERMDGRVLPMVDSIGTEQSSVVTPHEPQATDNEAVESHLEDLGYLE